MGGSRAGVLDIMVGRRARRKDMGSFTGVPVGLDAGLLVYWFWHG